MSVGVLDEETPYVTEDLTEEEAYLFAILTDESGLDQAEFLIYDPACEDNEIIVRNEDGTCARDEAGQVKREKVRPAPSGCFRAWDFQVWWWRNPEMYQIDQCARSVGKSQSILVRGCAFPFVHPGLEMVVTAPELIHLEPIVSKIEQQFYTTWFLSQMLPRGKSAVTHRPFQMNFLNGARIIGRIPQRDGKGVKGCPTGDTPILTKQGMKFASEVRVGDELLSHAGKWQKVTGVYEDHNDCYEVKGQGSFPMTVSCDHRFLGATNEAGPKQARSLSALGWHDVELLKPLKVYWASPTAVARVSIPDVDLPVGDERFWWLVGRWLADGYLSSDKKNNKARKVHWVVHPDDQGELLSALEVLDRKARVVGRSHSSADSVEVGHAELHRFLGQHFDQHADGKRLPTFVYSLDAALRRRLLDGYLAGDGHRNDARHRWEVGSASKLLAVGVHLLAQTLGHTVNCSAVQPKVTHVMGVPLKGKPRPSWRLQIMDLGHGHPTEVNGWRVSKVKSVEKVGLQKVYDIRVEEDHSYLSGSIMSHNIHPIWLELDEAQDYPKAGWKELTETLKRGVAGARWRSHGVTRGVRDDFYEKTQDSSNWYVHRFPAMWRPNWTDKEREDAIAEYDSRDDPDYRRNVLGLHGDATNPIFVLTQLMKNVDNDPLSDYNAGEYFKQVIKAEELELLRVDITHFLDFPAGHLAYLGDAAERKAVLEGRKQPRAIYWVGMDVGFTIDPSEILIFVEYREKPRDPVTKLRLLSRLSLWRMPVQQQVMAILAVIDFYRPKVFALDRNGIGLPLWQLIQDHLDAFKARDLDKIPAWFHGFDLERAATSIKGYTFGQNLIVDFDKTIEVGRFDDAVEKAGMKREAKAYSTDQLRELVDQSRLWLPWDEDFLKQFQGATWTAVKGGIDQYGRRMFSKGNDHCLDAAREMALGWAQYSIEETIAAPKTRVPVLDTFVEM